ncbi:hypothetical protein ACIQU5_25015 [Streptomyces sp. NPDC090306]|uniref:hypothetical protein n=1 Tax=Streptomyces sp. NPDC090306 TaxID=3365961 RepID=UPI00382F8601
MNSGRPTTTPSRTRVHRAVALTAGATLGLGALAAALPLATGDGTVDTTGTVALAADATTPSVSLGSTSVKPGGDVSFTVTGFPAGGTLSVKFDDTTLLKQFTIGDDGGFSGSVTVPAGATVGDGHWLRFLSTGTSVRSDALSVVAESTPTPTPTPTATPTKAADPAIGLGSSSVRAGGKVSFDLSGFAKGQTVTVKLDDADIIGQWKSAVGADGTFSASVTVPAGTSAGAHWLRVLAADPATSLKADITVTASGSGGGDGGSPSGSGGSSSGGSSSGGSSSGGSGSGGSSSGGSDSGSGGGGSTGSASGGSGTSGTTATVTGGSRVAAGGTVSYRVTGFPAGQQLTVKLDDETIVAQTTIGSDGSRSGSVTVPDDITKGAHWLRFLAPNPPTSLKAAFTVTSGAEAGTSGSGTTGSTGADGADGTSATPVPEASGEPASATNDAGARATITATKVQAGGRLHFRVTKFPASQQVTLKLDDEDILGQWKTDADGAYEGDVTVPAGTSAGAHWLRFLAPNPPTTLKVGFTVTAATAAAASGDDTATTGTGSGDIGSAATTANAASLEAPVSYATIAWSAAAAAVGGAAGAAATTLYVVRRRTSSGGTATTTPAAG